MTDTTSASTSVRLITAFPLSRAAKRIGIAGAMVH